MNLVLFGQQVNIAPGTTQPLEINGIKLANVSNEGDKLINVAFINPLDFSLANTYRLEIAKDTIIKINLSNQATNSITGSAKITVWTYAISPIQPFVEAGNLYFKTASKDLSRYITQKFLNSPFSGVYENMRFRNFSPDTVFKGFSADLAGQKLEVYTIPIKITVQDYLADAPVEHLQELSLRQLILSADRFTLLATSANGVFYLHPDTLTLFDQQDDNDNNLFIQYQFALVNGEVAMDYSPAYRLQSMFWQSLPFPSHKSSLLLLKYADENGVPIAVIPPDNTRIQMVYREGLSGTIEPGHTFPNNEFQQTIRGISINEVVNCTIASISFASVNWQKREQHLYGIDWNGSSNEEMLALPFWLSQNAAQPAVQLDSNPPDAIYGLTKGAWLKNKAKEKIVASLTMQPVTIETARHPVYHLHGFKLQQQQWDLHSLFEEKESRSMNNGSTIARIESRKFISPVAADLMDGASFEVPATDYHFAATNIYHPDILSEKAAPATEITKAVSNKITGINESFSGYSFTPTNQEHISKFQRIYTVKEEKPQALLQTLPIVTKQPAQLERLPLQLQNLSEKKEKPELSLSFVHGKKTDNAAGVTKAFFRDNAQRTLLQKVKELQRIWNEGLFLIESETLEMTAADKPLQKLAKHARKIRHYLDGDTQPELRVKFLDKYYRLKLKAVAPANEQKRLLFEQMRTYIDGNLNAVAGIGHRVRVLRPWVAKMKKKIDEGQFIDFEKLWDKGIEKWNTSTEEERLLNAIFDFVYKQPDRELINNLISLLTEIEKLPPELQQSARELKTYFKELFESGSVLLEGAVQTVSTQVLQGIDPYVVSLKELWDGNLGDCTGISASQLKGRYGSFFDVQTYKKIIQDNDEKIIKCLEAKLRNKLKAEFEKLLDNLIAKILADIENNADKLLATYEEDILALFLLIEKTEKFLDEHQQLLVLLKQLDSKEKLKKALKDLEPALKKAVYNYAKEYLLDHYGHQLKELEVIANEEIDKLVDTYWDEILVILHLIDEYKHWKDVIIPAYKRLFNRAVASIKALLKDISRKEVLLGLLKDYLRQKHGINISFADLRVDPPQYIVYSKQVSFNIDPHFVEQFNGILSKLHLDKYQLCNLGGGKSWDFLFSDTAIYILKLGNDMTAHDILTDINERNKKLGAKNGPLGSTAEVQRIEGYFHQDISSKNWRGLIVLNPVADIGRDELLRDLAGKSQVKMVYAAIGGAENLFSGGLDVYARVMEDNKPDAQEKDKDANFTLVKFDASIKNTQLESGDITFFLDFKNIFGKENEFERIVVKGSVPPKTPGNSGPRSFEFSAQLERPKVFELDIAFLDKLEIRGITAARKDNKSTLDIDGSLSFKNFGDNGGNDIVVYENQKQNQVVLKDFRLIIPQPPPGTSTRIGIPRGIDIDVSGIEFEFNKPRPINFGFIELLPKGISYFRRFEDNTYRSFIGSKIWITNNKPPEKRSFTCLNLKLNFGKLPAMGGTGIGNLELNGILGFTIEGGVEGPFFAIDSVNGKDVSIDLFRFITITIKRLLISTGMLNNAAGSKPITFIRADDVQLKILGWSPLGKDGQFSFVFVQKKPEGAEIGIAPNTGFAAIAEKKKNAQGNEQGWKLGPVTIYWIFIAHNLVFESSNLFDLLVNPVIADEGAFTKLQIYDENNDKVLQNLSFSNEESWLFGASFAIANILERCSIILHDQHFYGIMLASKAAWFKKVFGTDKLALAYMPGRTKEQDRFRIEFGVPALNFLGNLQSGLVAIEYALNRDFLVDFGFPWRSGKTYLWSRTFALRGGIYETRFGFYFEKKTEALVRPGQGGKLVTLGAGVGLYYGYYIGSRNAFAWAEAGIGVTVILTGSVTFCTGNSALPTLNSSIERVEVTGVIGIYAYAEGGIDYWIFSAAIRAEVVAALQGTLIYLPKGNSTLTFSATLSVKYKASATIKIGFARKTFRISGSLSYGVSGRIALN